MFKNCIQTIARNNKFLAIDIFKRTIRHLKIKNI